MCTFLAHAEAFFAMFALYGNADICIILFREGHTHVVYIIALITQWMLPEINTIYITFLLVYFTRILVTFFSLIKMIKIVVP